MLPTMLEVTVNPVNVPTLVTLGCAFVVSVPVNKLALNVPVVEVNVRLASPTILLPFANATCVFDRLLAVTLAPVIAPDAFSVTVLIVLEAVILVVLIELDKVTPSVLEVIVCEPSIRLLPDKYKSLHARVELPKSYAIFVSGIKLPVTNAPALIVKLPTVALPAVLKLPTVALPVTFAVPPDTKLPTVAVLVIFAVPVASIYLIFKLLLEPVPSIFAPVLKPPAAFAIPVTFAVPVTERFAVVLMFPEAVTVTVVTSLAMCLVVT